MAYEHLYSNSPISRELNYKGKNETVYFKPLNAGERLLLKTGQKGSVKAGETSFQVDLGDEDARNQKYLYFVNCTADGKRVFKNEGEVKALPSDLLDELLKLARDALAESDEGNA
jgi:hypothetical protein